MRSDSKSWFHTPRVGCSRCSHETKDATVGCWVYSHVRVWNCSQAWYLGEELIKFMVGFHTPRVGVQHFASGQHQLLSPGAHTRRRILINREIYSHVCVWNCSQAWCLGEAYSDFWWYFIHPVGARYSLRVDNNNCSPQVLTREKECLSWMFTIFICIIGPIIIPGNAILQYCPSQWHQAKLPAYCTKTNWQVLHVIATPNMSISTCILVPAWAGSTPILQQRHSNWGQCQYFASV